MSRRPVCVKCERDMKPEQNGVWCCETAGTDRRPYKLWHCDLWKCPRCGTEILHGFARQPRAIDDEIEELLAQLSPGEKVIFSHEKDIK